MMELFRALFLLEFIARLVGLQPPGQPYLLSFTAAEPPTDFERGLYAALWGDDDEC